MFNKNTVIILGAGSSHEFGLPTGSTLTKIISSKLDIRYDWHKPDTSRGDWELFSQIKQKFPDKAREFQLAGWLVRDGIQLANSIDDFLDLHQSNQEAVYYGKMAIVRSILEAEKKSSLYFKNNNQEGEGLNYAKLENTWIVKFMRIAGRGASIDNIFNNISFINFNYDRCLEHFMINALPILYGIKPQEAHKALLKLKIFHPYGCIAPLKSTNHETNEGILFGGGEEQWHSTDYFKCSNSINTYTEKVYEKNGLDEMKKVLAHANCLIFLGFGFHLQNMDLLKTNDFSVCERVFATASGFSTDDCDHIFNQIIDLFSSDRRSRFKNTHESKNIKIRNNLKCHELFDEYRKSIT